MKVQIYTMQSVEESLEVVDAGVYHVGLTPSALGLPGEISFATAASIAEAVRTRRSGQAKSVALSVETELDPIVEMIRTVKPDIVHLCGPGELPAAGDVQRLRELLGQSDETSAVEIMQAISVDGPAAVDRAQAFEQYVDYIILDTQDADIPGIGASGAVHDWTVSRRIVETLSVPVILAGGLSPENVGKAVRSVRPWAVDSLTHTNEALTDGGFRKSIERVREFVEEASKADWR